MSHPGIPVLNYLSPSTSTENFLHKKCSTSLALGDKALLYGYNRVQQTFSWVCYKFSLHLHPLWILTLPSHLIAIWDVSIMDQGEEDLRIKDQWWQFVSYRTHSLVSLHSFPPTTHSSLCFILTNQFLQILIKPSLHLGAWGLPDCGHYFSFHFPLLSV